MSNLCIIEDSNEDRITLFVTYPNYWEDEHISEAFEQLISLLPGYHNMERVNYRDRRFIFKPTNYVIYYQKNLVYYIKEILHSYDFLYQNLHILNNN